MTNILEQTSPGYIASLLTATAKPSGDRSITSSYFLADIPSSPGYLSTKVVFQVSTHHSKEGKEFFSLARQVKVSQTDRGYSVLGYFLYDGVVLSREKVARFSQKGLAAAHAQAIAVVESVLTSSETLQALFEVKSEVVES